MVKGGGHFVRTPETEETVLQYVENNPSVNTQNIAGHVHMSHVTAWRILQEMLLADYSSQFHFYHWYLKQTILQADVANCVLFTDGSMFHT